MSAICWRRYAALTKKPDNAGANQKYTSRTDNPSTNESFPARRRLPRDLRFSMVNNGRGEPPQVEPAGTAADRIVPSAVGSRQRGTVMSPM